MNQKFNFVFCKHHGDTKYCFKHCDKMCPSVSNLWYTFIRNPIVNSLKVVKYKFQKCNQKPTKCSFLYRNKYCLFKDRYCYPNRKG